MRRIGRRGFWLAILPVVLSADSKKEKLTAIVAGTVFRDTGFVMRGAEIEARPNPQGKKKSAWKAVSDARGEFVLRLPAGPASYNVLVRAAGYRPQEKTVTFSADERLDFNFLLEPTAEKK